MALPEDFLYQLKMSNSIDSVMSSYTTLNRRGHNYVCLCPFHSEKSPSCTVYNDTQSFYCFGCGAGGDVITFIMKIENLEYIEAVRFLAQRANIPMPEDNMSDNSTKIKQRTYEINRASAKFFFSSLKSPSGAKGLKYLLDRGLTARTIQKYGLGYADDKWNTLKNHLLAEGFLENELITAGLCSKSKSGNVFDVFRNRVIFPIIDLRGNVIAFGGRLLDGEGPKYLNSSDTPVFKKSKNLFSLNFAKNDNSRKLILAEGYMDVIAVNQAGFENTVATLGTALTPEQARLMSQYADEIIISYDSDEAGQKATFRAINLLNEAGLKTKILKMQGAKDPDEFIKKFGATRFKLLIDNSEGAIAFELNKCKNGLDMDTDISKVEYLKRCVKVLSNIEGAIERDVYIARVASEQNVSTDYLRAEVAAAIKKRNFSIEKKKKMNIMREGVFAKDRVDPESNLNQKQIKAEKGLIVYLFKHPDHLHNIRSKLNENNFISELNTKIYNFLVEKITNSKDYSITSFSSEFSPDEMGKISEMLAKSRDIVISEDVLDDYITIINTYDKNAEGSVNGSDELSDSDFEEYYNKLKSKI